MFLRKLSLPVNLICYTYTSGLSIIHKKKYGINRDRCTSSITTCKHYGFLRRFVHPDLQKKIHVHELSFNECSDSCSDFNECDSGSELSFGSETDVVMMIPNQQCLNLTQVLCT